MTFYYKLRLRSNYDEFVRYVSMNISTENLFIGNDFHILIYITRNLHLTCNIASKLSSSYIIQLESFKYPKSFFLNWTCQMSNVAGRFHHKPTIELQKFCFAYHYLTINNTKWWCQNQITVKTNWLSSEVIFISEPTNHTNWLIGIIRQVFRFVQT